MGLKIFNVKLSSLKNDQFIRFDTDYIDISKQFLKYKKSYLKQYITFIETGKSITREDYADEVSNYAHIVVRNIKHGHLELNNLVYLNEAKGKILSKFQLEKNDILIAISSNVGSSCLIEQDYNDIQLTLSHYILRLRVDGTILNPKFLVYYLNSEPIKYFFRSVETGKTLKNLSKVYIHNLPILFSLTIKEQNIIIEKIKPLEDEIKILKSKKQEHLEIINEVFANHFDIDLDEVNRLENIKQFNLPLKLSSLKNSSLRTSYKWHKLEIIQSYIYQDIDCVQKLDKFITNMNNGWSPESSEIEDGTAILGQEHIQKNGTISLSASKFTTKTKNNIENFYIKQNDFFVSRGNTVELVALASVVVDELEENILYPDLYIRVDFDDEFVNKQYMAFLFNSFIGRVYFKHVAKGKNQTMVKVSAKELYDFYVPLPLLDVQEQIIKEVEVKIEAQQNVDIEIEEKELEISCLIESVIK